jgi:hypothetical protein
MWRRCANLAEMGCSRVLWRETLAIGEPSRQIRYVPEFTNSIRRQGRWGMARGRPPNFLRSRLQLRCASTDGHNTGIYGCRAKV